MDPRAWRRLRPVPGPSLRGRDPLYDRSGEAVYFRIVKHVRVDVLDSPT